ncbi:DEAD/DEAH box helicase [Propylenella binzhouense]|uniref:DEAD-box ATP-dependent RNA helicase RhpA n=1 Tax=Propylenella binzhouense TaxID=2555902 RepID=A0A964T2H3_9HYPH|nr:DEAD/DEAH box helicase [Propylenella binzhouense]MYZ47203.1 DEAD/DEAH box helicase [Propylenella binzhouense]
MSFDDLGLSDKVVSAVKAVGYTTPTPIQEQAIPHVLARRDVLGLAQTGTGKTASFTLPMLTILEQGRARARMPRTLVLEPTRELAAQVQESFDRYGVNHKLNVALLIGGVSFDEQDKKITRGADVLIATPGRLLDHFERGRLLLTGVEFLVIDEADRMLDMGFIPDIERIVKLLPPTRQTMLFSATMPAAIGELAAKFLRDPVRIEVSKASSTAENITQKLIASGSKPHDKRATLRRLIDGAENLKNAIVFCNRKRDVATLHRSLERHGYSAGALHGDMDQHARLRTLDAFRDGQIAILVASDVAARGLDIPAVSHVFNFDVPTHAEDYVHRIGRTGRAGRSGESLTIVTKPETKYVQAIEKLIGQEIPWGETDFSGSAGEEEDVPRGRGRSRGKPAGDELSADGEGRKSRRRRRSGKSEAGEDEAAVATAAEPKAEKPRARSDEKPSRNRRGERRREREEDLEDASRAVGFADHVPAFLLRPVKLPRNVETTEDA